MRILETDRLLLRTWTDQDLEPMLAINQDSRVMEYLLPMQAPKQTSELLNRIRHHFTQYGYCLYATVRKDTGAMIGFIGFNRPSFSCHFTPTVEIGWRLASTEWGKGLATEGARAVLDYGFQHWKLPEIVSFTTKGNVRSRRVMEKIGLQHNPQDDFDHPLVPPLHPLKKHVLYRLDRTTYLRKAEPGT
ncbi:MAG: GNAT family N-acetyltransferase [Chlamydiota bacterium]